MFCVPTKIECLIQRASSVIKPNSPSLLSSTKQIYGRSAYLYRFSGLKIRKTTWRQKSLESNILKPSISYNGPSFSISTAGTVENLCNLIISQSSESFEAEQVEELNKILSFLLAKGCSSNDIQEKSLPFLKSSNCSYVKFKELECIGPDIALLLPLLTLPLSVLRLAAKQARLDKDEMKFPNRISYLSRHLELKDTEVVPLLAKHSALLTMKFKRLDYKMQMLKNANIEPKYLVKDLWIFNYNENLLVARIQAALKANVELKPWMLRCSKKFFESMLTRNSETSRILDGEDIVKYLAKQLDCSIEYVEYMMERNKLLKAVNIPKIDQILNFLFQRGYTPQEIRLFPRVFCSSVQTLSKRFSEYQQVKSTLPTISQLCISSKNFERLKDKS